MTTCRVRITFKPDDHRDAVIRFDYNDSTGKTKETVLFPVPYAFQTAEQSLQNAQFGDRLLLVADERGEYAYCPREEQQRRIKFLKQNKNASVMLSMGWEVKDGDVPETTEPESELPVFGNLTEPALVDFLSDPAEKSRRTYRRGTRSRRNCLRSTRSRAAARNRTRAERSRRRPH